MSTEAEEYFDIVDAHDTVIGQKPRSEVHRLGLRHRAVHLFVFRNDGQLLIHLRAADKEEFPGVWTSSAAGHVAAGETYAAAARRELLEELGIDTSPERVCRFDAGPDTCMEFTELYECVWDGDIRPDAGEIQAVEWITVKELRHRMQESPETFSPAFRLTWSWYITSRLRA